MIGLDTSIVLRLLMGEPVDQTNVAKKYLDQLFESGDQAAISDLVVSEIYFALQYHYNVPKGEALEALRMLFKSGVIRSAGHASSVLEKTHKLASAKPGFVDRLIHAKYVAQLDGMATFEKKAGKLDGVTVLK